MKLLVVGLGYVGLTHVAYLSSFHDVIGYDIDPNKIEALQQGTDYLYEPQLMQTLHKHRSRITWWQQLPSPLPDLHAVILAVGTPEAKDGSCDLRHVEDALDTLARLLSKGTTIVLRSTVPPGTHAQLRLRLAKVSRDDLHLISMPEFMVLGQTLKDIQHPTRVVLGIHHAIDENTVKQIFQYGPKIPWVITQPESAELAKYAANAFLATKVAFINQMADLASTLHANIDDVVLALGYDPRIGASYLQPSVGYGGSCFPKDLKAFEKLSNHMKVDAQILTATQQSNQIHMERFTESVLSYFNHQLAGKKIAILGLSFKGNSIEVRHSPALFIVDQFVDKNATIHVYDKKATFDFFEARGEKPCLAYATELNDALKDADACVILTDAPEIKQLKAIDFIKLMKTPVIFDGRNLYPLEAMKGTTYMSMGRPIVS